ncbi:MAG: hypothetical protein J7647_24975 [Cyanobacteria bacterium SBLK]|nr:hypothetical protein [Cyanobacteria bacterium SBLK]
MSEQNLTVTIVLSDSQLKDEALPGDRFFQHNLKLRSQSNENLLRKRRILG